MDGHRPALHEINRNLGTSKYINRPRASSSATTAPRVNGLYFFMSSLDANRRVNGFVYASTSIEQCDIKSFIDFGIYSSFYFCVYDTIYTYMGIVSPCGQRPTPRRYCVTFSYLQKLNTVTNNLLDDGKRAISV